MTPAENPEPARHRAAWMALVVLGAVLTALAVYGFNRYVHQPYVTFEGPKKSLRLMTWNIGRIYLKWESRASDRDLDYVARVIREVNPHVVALQEIRDATQLGRLVSAVGPKWRAKVPTDAYDRRAALMTRLSARFFELPTSSGRTAQGAVAELPGGRRLTIASVHLDAFDAARRLQQAEEIMAGAERLGQAEIFLAGDFNVDVAAAERDSVDQRLYRFLTRTFSDGGAAAGGTTLSARRLDYLFFRSMKASVIGARVLRNRRINSMDHHPLVVEIEMHK